jgi:hypothetical protein
MIAPSLKGRDAHCPGPRRFAPRLPEQAEDSWLACAEAPQLMMDRTFGTLRERVKLALDRREEALDDGVVVAVPAPAHAARDAAG